MISTAPYTLVDRRSISLACTVFVDRSRNSRKKHLSLLISHIGTVSCGTCQTDLVSRVWIVHTNRRTRCLNRSSAHMIASSKIPYMQERRIIYSLLE